MSIWCFYDVAGRHWVKLKKYQQSLREREAALIAQTLATTSLQDGFSVIPEEKSEKKEPSKADKILLDVMENAKSYPPI